MSEKEKLALIFKDDYSDNIVYMFYTIDLADMVTLIDWKGSVDALRSMLFRHSDNVASMTIDASWETPNLKSFALKMIEQQREEVDFVFLADGSMRAPIKYKAVKGVVKVPIDVEVRKTPSKITYVIKTYRWIYISDPLTASLLREAFDWVVGTKDLGSMLDVKSITAPEGDKEVEEKLRAELSRRTNSFIIPSKEHPFSGFPEDL